MSGTAVIMIIVLALLVVVGGSILVLGIFRREHRLSSDVHQVDNSGEQPTGSNQKSGHPED